MIDDDDDDDYIYTVHIRVMTSQARRKGAL